jgi:hypothetical protein
MIINRIPLDYGRSLLARINLKKFIIETDIIADSGKYGLDIVVSRFIDSDLNINPGIHTVGMLGITIFGMELIHRRNNTSGNNMPKIMCTRYIKINI